MSALAKWVGIVAVAGSLVGCSSAEHSRGFTRQLQVDPPVTPEKLQAAHNAMNDRYHTDQIACLESYKQDGLPLYEQTGKFPMSGKITDQSTLDVIRCMQGKGWILEGPPL